MKTLFILCSVHFLGISVLSNAQESGIRLSTDENDSFVQEIVMVNPSVDAQENLGSGELLIYPLVSSSVVNVIKTSETKKVYIGRFVDISGRIVKIVELDALHNEINMETLALGDYLLRITSGDKQITEIRITKEPSVQ